MIRPFLFSVLLAWVVPAWAHSEVDARNRASFQVEASREVANDWATARFSVVDEGKDPAHVAESVNTRMTSALAIARQVEGFTVESAAYVTQPVYDEGRIVRWRARQELRVESGDVDQLAYLIGRLQSESVVLASIDFSVQKATRTAIEDELIDAALAAFRARASRIATGMGAKDWSLVTLSVVHSGASPRMMEMRAHSDMGSMSKSAPPRFEAGTTEIKVRIDGAIEID